MVVPPVSDEEPATPSKGKKKKKKVKTEEDAEEVCSWELKKKLSAKFYQILEFIFAIFTVF